MRERTGDLVLAGDKVTGLQLGGEGELVAAVRAEALGAAGLAVRQSPRRGARIRWDPLRVRRVAPVPVLAARLEPIAADCTRLAEVATDASPPESGWASPGTPLVDAAGPAPVVEPAETAAEPQTSQ